jgi:hypothetical protein
LISFEVAMTYTVSIVMLPKKQRLSAGDILDVFLRPLF